MPATLQSRRRWPATALILSAFLVLTGCRPASDYKQSEGPPVSGAPEICTKSCNSEFDACMDQFASGPSATSNSGIQRDDPSSMFTGDARCSYDLKSCLKRCPG